MMPLAIGFDVYGTLVDPFQMEQHLTPHLEADARRFALLWRDKQIEYSFRRAVMGRYVDFDVCTQQALAYVMMVAGITLTDAEQRRLAQEYRRLPPFPEAKAALTSLRSAGVPLVAFTNGLEASVRRLLDHAGLLDRLDDVISVDDLQSFKPNPEVYRYLARRLNRDPGETWLVSGNAWDVIGAKSAGLRAAWVQRSPTTVFDPWGIEPDLIVSTLMELSMRMA